MSELQELDYIPGFRMDIANVFTTGQPSRAFAGAVYADAVLGDVDSGLDRHSAKVIKAGLTAINKAKGDIVLYFNIEDEDLRVALALMIMETRTDVLKWYSRLQDADPESAEVQLRAAKLFKKVVNDLGVEATLLTNWILVQEAAYYEGDGETEMDTPMYDDKAGVLLGYQAHPVEDHEVRVKKARIRADRAAAAVAQMEEDIPDREESIEARVKKEKIEAARG